MKGSLFLEYGSKAEESVISDNLWIKTPTVIFFQFRASLDKEMKYLD